MSEHPLRVAVVGCGGLGRREAAIAAASSGVSVVAVCDARAESAREVAAQLGPETQPYADYRAMIAATRPDAVLVVTPTHTHSEITVAAAQAGAHVFCEKPMALNLEECDRMLAACRQAGVFLMLGFVRRFQPNYREMRCRLQAGEIGAPRLLQSVRMGGRPPVGIGGWRLEARQVGGLHSAYIHELDQLLWLGGPVKTVRGVANYGTFLDTDVEDSIWFLMEFENGAIGAMGSSQIYPVGWYELGVGGTEGSMAIRGGTTQVLVRKHGGASETIELPNNDAFVEELRHFFDCVRQGRTPSVTGEDGRASLEVVLAAYRSARTGETVYLPLT
ncbi:MAG: Gfo/Idh/MocA family oxidoreductase [Armatimonadetes bacterium]|nr:Gfo/Idh/MocA family oxidoreductase [Armatimonadota bacterium]